MSIQTELNKHKNEDVAKTLSGFFKKEETENDVFLGIYLPILRKIAKKYENLSLSEIKKLLYTDYHEYRLVALLILNNQYKKTNDDKYVKFYLKHMKRINNWDLVDASASNIIGAYVYNHPDEINELNVLADSNNVWSRRIAIIATFYFIKQNRYDITLKIAKKLLGDKHHYIHKAVGWMLREVGKRNKKLLLNFLKENKIRMSKLTFRYAVERLTKQEKEKLKN
jgi:3-methyladenine DNA glycosylase AlkD